MQSFRNTTHCVLETKQKGTTDKWYDTGSLAFDEEEGGVSRIEE